MKILKGILRVLCVSIFLFFTWPFFLYKNYGNTKNGLNKSTVIISNHYSTFDPFFVYLHYFKYHITFVTIEEARKKLLSRFVTWIFDCIFLDSKTINVKAIKKSIKVLQDGGIICIYPEGIINPRKYGFFDFYKSYLLIAEKTKADIVPLYTYPELRPFKRSKLYIGDTIKYEQYMEYSDLEDRNAYFLSLIMDYSLKFEKPEDEQ